MRYLNTGKGSDGATLAPTGHAPGTAIVAFPGHGFCQVVEMGGIVHLPDDLPHAVVVAACPSLVLQTDVPAAPEAPPVKDKAAVPVVMDEEPAFKAPPSAEKPKRAAKE